MEILIPTAAIRNLIREAKTHQITSMIQTSGNMGMITMDQTLRDLYLRGWITLEDAMSRCQNPDELRKMINTPVSGQGSGPVATQSAEDRVVVVFTAHEALGRFGMAGTGKRICHRVDHVQPAPTVAVAVVRSAPGERIVAYPQPK